ncbi:Dabb family protein [Hydrogenophaga sp.]|uniref:Dabb family protein n=1 Tax=Hydrogenophaga sp. TaxID=1904254 RepID=UPI00271A7B6B|nr:Dabb family protein [Hydrogenophaga sp.]MDO9437051.1 Dabb family protein [Hydrogenophaga sp.]
MNPVKHVCAFSFRDDTSQGDRERMLSDLAAFPAKFPTMKNWTLNRNISERDQRFTHAFVVEFESVALLKAYLNSESHERFVKERFRPIIQERGIVTLEA